LLLLSRLAKPRICLPKAFYQILVYLTDPLHRRLTTGVLLSESVTAAKQATTLRLLLLLLLLLLLIPCRVLSKHGGIGSYRN